MSSLNCFGATDDTLQNLEVEGDGHIWGNLDVDGTVTATQFAGGTITPSFTLPDGSASSPALSFQSSTNSGLFWDTTGSEPGQAWSVSGTKRMKLDTKTLALDHNLSMGGFFTNGANGMTTGNIHCGAISSSGTFGNGPNAMTTGHLHCAQITSTSTFTNGTNPMTTGALSCTSLTSSGTMSCGTNACTCGALSCSDLTSTGTMSCGTNSMTCGELKCGAISNVGRIYVNSTNPSVNGTARIQLFGQNAAVANSPSILSCVTGNDYPLFHIIPFSHDSVEIIFDGYRVPTFGVRSGSINSNFRLRKDATTLTCNYASGYAPGDIITWQTGWQVNTAGEFICNDIKSSGNLTYDGSMSSPGQPAIYVTASTYVTFASGAIVKFNEWDTINSVQGGLTVENDEDIKISQNGNYLVTVQMPFISQSPPDNLRTFHIRKNDSITPIYGYTRYIQAAPSAYSSTATCIIKCSTNDLLSVYVSGTDTGGTFEQVEAGTNDTTTVAMFTVVKLF